jgi:hypothetical protein
MADGAAGHRQPLRRRRADHAARHTAARRLHHHRDGRDGRREESLRQQLPRQLSGADQRQPADLRERDRYAEIYANWSTHRDVRDIYTLDFALAWTPRPNFQLDVGINIGLVSAAIPYQIYMGIAQRF